ncbi:MAG: GreA/GreB family elongation factor [Candidatus Magasanikbacteria bacterium]|nr:GreA/GreB family elongation factor [Candidatus Magasanikbacteria bacterium]
MRTLNRKSEKNNQNKTDPFITEEKYHELKKTLEKLYKTRPKAAAEVSSLAEMGDFSENVEYQLAKGRLRGINNRILMLEQQLNHAVIISPQKKTDSVRIGHHVRIETEGKKIDYLILGSAESKPEKGIISHLSPLGSALLGHKVGESVTLRLAEREMEYKILKIE